MDGGATLNKAEFEVYDRQLRLWGFEAQARMKESKVLIVGQSNCCTELARHLTLSGCNLNFLTLQFKEDQQTSQEVEANQFLNEFLFTEKDVGQLKSEVIVKKLQEMNPFSKLNSFAIQLESTAELKEKLGEFLKEDKYTALVCPLEVSSLDLALEMNQVTRELGLPFYALNSTGLQGFFFADLGTDKFDYQYVKKAKEDGQADEQILSSIEGSKTLTQYVDSFTKPEYKLTWKKRELNKPHKLVLLSLFAQIMKHQKKINGLTTSYDVLIQFLKTKAGLQQHIEAFEDSQALKESIDRFENCWMNKIEFNPTASVVSAIASQEIIKVITLRDHPQHGLFIYDSDSQTKVIEKM